MTVKGMKLIAGTFTVVGAIALATANYLRNSALQERARQKPVQVLTTSQPTAGESLQASSPSFVEARIGSVEVGAYGLFLFVVGILELSKLKTTREIERLRAEVAALKASAQGS